MRVEKKHFPPKQPHVIVSCWTEHWTAGNYLYFFSRKMLLYKTQMNLAFEGVLPDWQHGYIPRATGSVLHAARQSRGGSCTLR